jgi:hypothetical protein
MKHLAQLLLIALIVVCCIAVFGCSRTVVYKESPSDSPPPPPGKTVKADHPGPPPHAPAHGYRHKHADGVVLVYSTEIGVYVVSGHGDAYYHKDWYYRMHKGQWQNSRHIEGPWRKCNDKKVPRGLHSQVADRDHGKGNKKGNKK